MPEEEMNRIDLGYEIRDYAPEQDEPFIYGAWIDAVRATGSIHKPVQNNLFFRAFRRTIDLVLERGASVLVAAQINSPVILGYVVSEPNLKLDGKDGVLHWVYVKANWRRLGVATRLILETGIDPNKAYYTIRTRHELGLPTRRRSIHGEMDGKKVDWVSLREERMHLAADLEEKGIAEGDTHTLIQKWPGLAYNPFLLPTPFGDR